MRESEKQILSHLPGHNCGGCGFPDCRDFAGAAAAGGAPICYNGASHPYWYLDDGAGGGTAGDGICQAGETNGAKLDAKALKATFNYKWSQAEPGA